MSRSFIVVTLLALCGLLAIGAYLLRQRAGEDVQASLAVAEALESDTTGFLRAQQPRAFVFPDDLGPHPGYKTEWWYYTGNLVTDADRRFGYELTIFRIALAPPDTSDPARSSDWATNQLYMAHFAVSDVENERFYAFERFSRGALGLAGAQAEPYRVWLEDWVVESGPKDAFPMRLQARQGDVAVELTLEAAKPVVLQGDRGLDQKGPGPGNASYYYSFTRLRTEGTVTVEGDTFAVRGLSWKDHEWSTSALGADQVGWDWFALQLSDNSEVMYYQIRRRDGTPSPYTSGTLVASDGTTQSLALSDVELQVLDTWTSPEGGTYPARWRLRVPSADLDLVVVPYFAAQELNVSVRYWEGAVRVEGTREGRPVTGSGYVELTGYADEGSVPAS